MILSKASQPEHVWKENAVSLLVRTVITSTAPTTAVSPTPIIAAAPRARAARPHKYAQTAHAQPNAKRRFPNAITNVITMRTTSIIAEDATRHARKTT